MVALLRAEVRQGKSHVGCLLELNGVREPLEGSQQGRDDPLAFQKNSSDSKGQGSNIVRKQGQ